jgi:predicted RND superfamily exporter protein
MIDKVVEVCLLSFVLITYALKELMIVTSMIFDVTAFVAVVILATLLFRRITAQTQEAKQWREMNL